MEHPTIYVKQKADLLSSKPLKKIYGYIYKILSYDQNRINTKFGLWLFSGLYRFLTNIFKYLQNKPLLSIGWMIAGTLISCLNDVFMKLSGEHLPSFEIAFFRFFFSTLTILPFIRSNPFSLSSPSSHILRMILGVAAIMLSCVGVNLIPLSHVTTISFSQPIFVLFLAKFILKEHVDAKRTMASLVALLGVMITIDLSADKLTIGTLVYISAMILFALQDILIKNMVSNEKYVNMLFTFGLGSTIISLIPAILVWEMPKMMELCYLFLLGIGANLIQLCIFKAYTHAEVSLLAPFRYTELLFSVLLGFLIFGELPGLKLILGACFIIPATLYMAYRQKIAF